MAPSRPSARPSSRPPARLPSRPSIPQLTWRQVLAWRMRRHFLVDVAASSVAEVVDRLSGVQAQVPSAAELAVRARLATSEPGIVDRALTAGEIIRTWAMRGTLHLLTAESGPALLAVMAAGRAWERPSWERYFGASPSAIERLREVVHGALASGPLTRAELVAAVVAEPELAHLGEGLASNWGTLLKPLAWQGTLCLGERRGNGTTFVRPDLACPRWPGLPPPEVAGSAVVAGYLAAFGPATQAGFGDWLARGWFSLRRIRDWFAALGDRVAEVEVEGERRLVLAEDLDELLGAEPVDAVAFLPGFDQYVLGAGTADSRVVPAANRSLVSRPGGWIAPVVLLGGIVAGTWEVDGCRLAVAWFSDAATPSRAAFEVGVERLAGLLGRRLEPIETVV